MIASKTNPLGMDLTKEIKHIYNENYKPLNKGLEEGTRRMK
jgi:hypothetical protein